MVVLAFGLAACAGSERRFQLRSPVTRDPDLDLVTLACGAKAPCIEPYVSSFAWDGIDNSLFRPMTEGLRLKPVGAARDVNAFDEVPDSSWFTNRIGVRELSATDVQEGYCQMGKKLDPALPDGAWLIDHGKDNGANPGFRVNVGGVKYMLKLDNVDDHQGERATAATSIATRLYYAAGWWAPCDAVVWFRRGLFTLEENLEIVGNIGKPVRFDEKKLDEMLSKTVRRGDLFHAAASRWVPGVPLGPFTYEGVRPDDPSDVIPHEHRRVLRGARIMAAWLNHFDTREQNSMDTWMSANLDERADGHIDGKPTNRGYVRHWYIDLGDSFGSEWTVPEISRRLGYTYVLDWSAMAKDFASLGIPEHPWDHNQRSADGPIFGFFSNEDFDPAAWRGEYPNPAFSNMQEADAAWATRIIARFTPAQIAAAVRAGDFSEPRYGEFLVRVLLARQRAIEARYFSVLSPLTDVTVEGHRVCAVDLARKTNTWNDAQFHYRASVGTAAVESDGRVCVSVPPSSKGSYVVLRIANGIAREPIALHFYDLGASLQLVGIDR